MSAKKPKVPEGLPGSKTYKGPKPNPGSGVVKSSDRTSPEAIMTQFKDPAEDDKRDQSPEFDPFGSGEQGSEPEVAVPTRTQKADIERKTAAQAPDNPEVKKVNSFLAKRVPITLELADTFLMVKAISIVETPYAVTLILPTSGDGFTFIPKPGSSVVINAGGIKRIPCFFPGTSFEIEELSLLGLAFVKADEEGEKQA